MKREEIKRLEKIEQMVDENGVFMKTGSSMNMGILEDDYEIIEDEIKWIISHAKKQAKKIKELEEAFDRKTKVHDKLNRDYVEMRDKQK